MNRLIDAGTEETNIKPVGYLDCANAMMKMWTDNIVTDGEYSRIMDRLNAHEMAKNNEGKHEDSY